MVRAGSAAAMATPDESFPRRIPAPPRTLGLSKEVSVGFQNIRLQFTLDTDASEEQLATPLRLTERYCVVYQTLAHPPVLEVVRRRGAV